MVRIYLKCDTANRQVLVILQHAEVFGHEGGSVDQTHSRLSVTLPVVVFLCHVLEPGQTQVRRRLVTLCYPGGGRAKEAIDKVLGVNAAVVDEDTLMKAFFPPFFSQLGVASTPRSCSPCGLAPTARRHLCDM